MVVALLWLCLGIVQSALADERPGHPYICSNGQVYSVRVQAGVTGFNLKGPWQKFLGFCNSSIGSLHECIGDHSAETIKCLREFKARGNVQKVGRHLAVQPSKIRHAPSERWLQLVADLHGSKINKVCTPALVMMGCFKNPRKFSRGAQLQCLYEKSSYANRSVGRRCYAALNAKLDPLARQTINSSHAVMSASIQAPVSPN
jgi:hypothetical protein